MIHTEKSRWPGEEKEAKWIGMDSSESKRGECRVSAEERVFRPNKWGSGNPKIAGGYPHGYDYSVVDGLRCFGKQDRLNWR